MQVQQSSSGAFRNKRLDKSSKQVRKRNGNKRVTKQVRTCCDYCCSFAKRDTNCELELDNGSSSEEEVHENTISLESIALELPVCGKYIKRKSQSENVADNYVTKSVIKCKNCGPGPRRYKVQSENSDKHLSKRRRKKEEHINRSKNAYKKQYNGPDTVREKYFRMFKPNINTISKVDQSIDTSNIVESNNLDKLPKYKSREDQQKAGKQKKEKCKRYVACNDSTCKATCRCVTSQSTHKFCCLLRSVNKENIKETHKIDDVQEIYNSNRESFTRYGSSDNESDQFYDKIIAKCVELQKSFPKSDVKESVSHDAKNDTASECFDLCTEGSASVHNRIERYSSHKNMNNSKCNRTIKTDKNNDSYIENKPKPIVLERKGTYVINENDELDVNYYNEKYNEMEATLDYTKFDSFFASQTNREYDFSVYEDRSQESEDSEEELSVTNLNIAEQMNDLQKLGKKLCDKQTNTDDNRIDEASISDRQLYTKYNQHNDKPTAKQSEDKLEMYSESIISSGTYTSVSSKVNKVSRPIGVNKNVSYTVPSSNTNIRPKNKKDEAKRNTEADSEDYDSCEELNDYWYNTDIKETNKPRKNAHKHYKKKTKATAEKKLIDIEIITEFVRMRSPKQNKFTDKSRSYQVEKHCPPADYVNETFYNETPRSNLGTNDISEHHTYDESDDSITCEKINRLSNNDCLFCKMRGNTNKYLCCNTKESKADTIDCVTRKESSNMSDQPDYRHFERMLHLTDSLALRQQRMQPVYPKLSKLEKRYGSSSYNIKK